MERIMKHHEGAHRAPRSIFNLLIERNFFSGWHQVVGRRDALFVTEHLSLTGLKTWSLAENHDKILAFLPSRMPVFF
jgi:hypothetical protein